MRTGEINFSSGPSSRKREFQRGDVFNMLSCWREPEGVKKQYELLGSMPESHFGVRVVIGYDFECIINML